jgi:hypothetical protein
MSSRSCRKRPRWPSDQPALNARGITMPCGGRWYAQSVNNVLARACQYIEAPGTPPPPHLLDFEHLKNPPQFLEKNHSKWGHQLECRNGMANVSIPGSIGSATRMALAHCEASKPAIVLYK